jgi:hypothetical protein
MGALEIFKLEMKVFPLCLFLQIGNESLSSLPFFFMLFFREEKLVFFIKETSTLHRNIWLC